MTPTKRTAAPTRGRPAVIPLRDRVDDALARLARIEFGDGFEPAAPAAIVAAGLHLAPVPVAAGGLGIGAREAVELLASIGAVDGSTALGFAMHVHVVAGMAQADGWSKALDDRVHGLIRDEGASINAASTEDAGGSPARGALPDTTATRMAAGGYRLTGEKSWTTWLPALRLALVSARIVDDPHPRQGIGPAPRSGSSSSTWRPRASRACPASARSGCAVPRPVGCTSMASACRPIGSSSAAGPTGPIRADRHPGPGSAWPWPGSTSALARVPGARSSTGLSIDAPAMDRRPWPTCRRSSCGSGDSTPPSARRGSWSSTWRRAGTPPIHGGWPALLPDIALAKLVATQAAVTATDEALRIAGGPGFLEGRLERAFRDARAGLINPPLEDVALAGFARTLVERERAGG